MKKLALIAIMLSIFASQCMTSQVKQPMAKKNNESPQKISVIEPVTSTDSMKKLSWYYYSTGLYYKNLGIRKNLKGLDDLDKALDFFKKAEKLEKSLEKIYFHMADCFYHKKDFTESLVYAKKAIALKKDWMLPYFKIFRIHVISKKHDEAAQILEDYLKINPSAIKVQFALAKHYLNELKDLKKAQAGFENTLTMAKTQIEDDNYYSVVYYYLGYIAYLNNDISESLKNFHQALTYTNDNKRILYIITYIYMSKFDFESAKKHAYKYLAIEYDNRYMHSVIGRINYIEYYTKNKPIPLIHTITHLRYGKDTKSIDGLISYALYSEIFRYDKKAEKIIQYMLAYRPNSIALHIALARTKTRSGDKMGAFNELLTAGVLLYKNKLFDEAEYCFLEANKLKDDVAGVNFYLGRINENKNKLAAAIKYYQRALQLRKDAGLFLHLGYLYGTQNNYDLAIDCFNEASKIEPKNAKPYFMKGLVSIWKKDYPIAEESILKAIAITDKNETYYFYLAIVMEKLNKLDKAIDSLEKAIKYNPKSARSLNFLGYLLADNNMKIDRSLSLVETALKIDPENAAYIDSLGWVYYRQGKFKAALEKLLKAEKMLRDSPDPVVYDHLGDTYKSLGDIKSAIKFWKKASLLQKDKKIEKKIKHHMQKK